MNTKQIAAIASLLETANGKRRTRTADLSQVCSLVRRVARGADGAGVRVIYGTVSNSYGYSAAATMACAVRQGAVVRVLVISTRAANVPGGGSGVAESAKNGTVKALLTGGFQATLTVEIPLESAKRAAMVAS